MRQRQLILPLLLTIMALLNVVQSYFVVYPVKEIDSKDEGGGFREKGLRIHNYYRTLNKATPLELDHELNQLAHAHAELLASWNNLTASESGFHENLWSHRGELLPLAKDVEYAVKSWYTGSSTPGKVETSVDTFILRSDSVKHVGFGVGTAEHDGQGYSVVVAFYQ